MNDQHPKPDSGRQSYQEGSPAELVSRLIVAATLPHSQPPTSELVRTAGAYDLCLLAPRRFGLPFGRSPRLVLAWLIAEAFKSRSPHIPLGPSLPVLASRLGIPDGTLADFRDQILRLLSVSFSARSRPAEDAKAGRFPCFRGCGFCLASSFVLWPADSPSSTARPAFVRLSQDLYDGIIARPIPLDLEVLRSFRSSLEMDVYTWLTFHLLSSLPGSLYRSVSWEVVERQFGSEPSNLRKSRYHFLRSLRSVLRVFPDLRATTSPLGLRFHLRAPQPGPTPRNPLAPESLSSIQGSCLL